jgi:zinc transport system substrate-binding protein
LTGEPAASDAPLVVFTVNAPLATFAERIGGDAVEVSFPAPPDVDPAFWSPAPEVVAAYQQADLVLRNGAGYASWVGRASLRSRRLVDTSAAFQERLIAIEDEVVHQHGPEGKHSRAAFAFSVWLDPRLAILQARAIAAAFAERRPGEKAGFEARLAGLEAELEALDRRLLAASRALGDAPLLLSHPVYQYAVARYGWNARSLHWEPDLMPADSEWEALDALLAEHPARWMLWEAEPLPEMRNRLAQQGVTIRVFSPAGGLSKTGDWLDVMQGNALALESLVARRP